MQISRRQFIEKSGQGILGTALLAATTAGSAVLLTGCAFSIAEVLTWAQQIGPGAISSILSLLVGAGVIACMTCSVLANVAVAAIAAIGTAVQNYENAPAASKATLIGKITTALQAALTASSTFFESVAIPDKPLADLIIGIASLVLNAITGFIGQLGGTLATKKVMLSAREIPITPTVLKASEFRSRFNKLVTQFGHPEQVMH